jgi:ComF family protein
VNGYDAAYSYGAYEGKLRELIHLFKYRGIFTLARPLAELTLRAFPREERFDLVVPMPMHWLRRWRRGFNQSALLSRLIGRQLGIPVVGAVRRQRPTPPQAGLSNSQRRENVSGAFSPARGKRLDGKRVLLVDDVFTTGATASACSRVLKRAGADYVAVLALARTDRRYQAELPGESKKNEAFAVGVT